MIYDVICDHCGAVVCAMDDADRTPTVLRELLAERLLQRHECAASVVQGSVTPQGEEIR